jgi:histidyl-tRNA synthetase
LPKRVEKARKDDELDPEQAGRDGVCAEMCETAGVSPEQACQVIALAGLKGSSDEVLDRVQKEYGANPRAAEGVRRLRELIAVTRTAGIPEGRIRIDLSIARGLDYYTGTIYETFLTDLEGIGSVCSGGRYDNLASLYTKQVLPGVGASLGLDRLLAAMEELDMLPKISTPAPVLVVQFDAERLGEYQKMARALRAEGIGVEVYPEAKRIGAQLKYADSRGFRVALIAGANEFAEGVWKVKDLALPPGPDGKPSEGQSVPAAEVVAAIRKILSTT